MHTGFAQLHHAIAQDVEHVELERRFGGVAPGAQRALRREHAQGGDDAVAPVADHEVVAVRVELVGREERSAVHRLLRWAITPNLGGRCDAGVTGMCQCAPAASFEAGPAAGFASHTTPTSARKRIAEA